MPDFAVALVVFDLGSYDWLSAAPIDCQSTVVHSIESFADPVRVGTWDWPKMAQATGCDISDRFKARQVFHGDLTVVNIAGYK